MKTLYEYMPEIDYLKIRNFKHIGITIDTEAGFINLETGNGYGTGTIQEMDTKFFNRKKIEFANTTASENEYIPGTYISAFYALARIPMPDKAQVNIVFKGGYKIIGFDADEGKVYLDWESYWYPISASRLVKAKNIKQVVRLNRYIRNVKRRNISQLIGASL